MGFVHCPHCNQDHPDSLQTCPNTGKPLRNVSRKGSYTCADCGRELPSEARFCMYCGNVIENNAQPVSLLEPVAQPEPPADLEELMGSPKGSSAKTRRLWWFSCFLLLCIVLMVLIGFYLMWQFTGWVPAQLAGIIAPTRTQSAAVVPGSDFTPTATLPPSPTPLPPTFTPTPTITSIPSSTPTNPSQPTQTEAGPTQSPESSILATSEIPPEYDLLFASNADGGFKIYAMNSQDTADWIVLPFPDGYENAYWPTYCQNRVAFEAHDFSMTLPRWIFFVELDGGSIESFTPPEAKTNRLGVPACSPSGRYMAYSARQDFDWYLQVTDLSSHSLTYTRGPGEYPMLGYSTWSNQDDFFIWMGFRITSYFDLNETSNFQRKGGEVTQFLTQGKYPALSPDGSRLAYFCGNLLSLCVIDLETGETIFEEAINYTIKLNDEQAPASASWSRDGEWIYFSSSATGNWDIYRIRPDGSDLENMTEDWLSDEIMPAAW